MTVSKQDQQVFDKRHLMKKHRKLSQALAYSKRIEMVLKKRNAT